MTTRMWDVVISGASLAGASLAIVAARGGLRVALIDAASFPRDKVCGEFLAPGIWPALSQLKLDAAVRGAAKPLTSMCLVAGGLRAAFQFPAVAEGLPAALSRFTLDAMLLDEARRAGAEVYPGYRVHEVLIERGRACGLKAVPIHGDSAELILRGQYVVAADGRRSWVVRQTGRVAARGADRVGFKSHWRVDSPLARGEELEMHSLPGGYFGFCPTESGELNACGVIPRRRLRAARGSLGRALREWAKGHPQATAILDHAVRGGNDDTHWHSIAEVARQSARPRLEGVLYVGDACGTIEPLTGQGMTMAVRSGIDAAALLLGLDGRTLNQRVQAKWHAAWHARNDSRICWAAAFGWLLSRPSLLSMLLPTPKLPGLIVPWAWQAATGAGAPSNSARSLMRSSQGVVCAASFPAPVRASRR